MSRFSPGGREVAFRRLVPGGYFGEMAAVDGGSHSANVIALRDSRVATMAAPLVGRLLDSSPPFCRALLTGAAASRRRLQTKLYEMNTLTLPSRLHVELVRLSAEAGIRANQAVVRDSPTHAELAALLGGQREAVSREFRRLTLAGLIQASGRSLHILDVSGLSALAEKAGGEPWL